MIKNYGKLKDEVREQYVTFLGKIDKMFINKNIVVPHELLPSNYDEYFKEFRAA